MTQRADSSRPSTLTAVAGLAVVLAGALSLPVAAQQVYRIVGPDGRVTFSDKPPATTDNARVTAATPGGGAGGPTLPFNLQQVVSRFPVTLYTGAECQPCITGRGLLMRRGVPFTEKTITTTEDAEALKRLSGGASLPFMTIGSQQIRGFSDVEWTQFLDAAGYPQTSQLPVGYRNPPASPLVVVQRPDPSRPQAGAEGGDAPAAAAAPAAPAPNISNPAGIRF